MAGSTTGATRGTSPVPPPAESSRPGAAHSQAGPPVGRHADPDGADHDSTLVGAGLVGVDRVGVDRVGVDRVGVDRVGDDGVGADRGGADRAGVDLGGAEVADAGVRDVGPGKDSYDALPDAVLLLDAAGVVTGLNGAAVTLVGLPSDAAIGQPLVQVAPLFDAAGRDWWACESRARAMRSVRRVPERLLTLRGGGQQVLLTARYVRRGDVLEQVVVVLRDTAARERLERSHADLISTVAHELRSPLTSVKGFTATMLAKWDRFTDVQKRQMLEWINNDADRVTRLLAELLDVSRIDAGRLELHRQVVDLRQVAERAFAGRVAAGEPPERFVLVADAGLPEMWLDPDKMEQVVGNLVENALRHGAGLVRVTVVAEGDGAFLYIDDEGDGVPDEIAARIFSKFFRGKSRRGGTGLGLYIVKGLVEAQGGTVSVLRAPSGGARFRVWLPAGAPTYAD